MRFKRSLPLYDAGPYTYLLTQQCLHMLYQLNDQVEVVAQTRSYYPLRDYAASERLQVLTQHINEVCEMLRAYFDRDPRISIGKAVSTLWEQKDRHGTCDPWERFFFW